MNATNRASMAANVNPIALIIMSTRKLMDKSTCETSRRFGLTCRFGVLIGTNNRQMLESTRAVKIALAGGSLFCCSAMLRTLLVLVGTKYNRSNYREKSGNIQECQSILLRLSRIPTTTTDSNTERLTRNVSSSLERQPDSHYLCKCASKHSEQCTTQCSVC